MYLFCCFRFGMTDLKKKADWGLRVLCLFLPSTSGLAPCNTPYIPSLLVRSKLQKIDQWVSEVRRLKALSFKLLSSGRVARVRGRRNMFMTKISSELRGD